MSVWDKTRRIAGKAISVAGTAAPGIPELGISEAVGRPAAKAPTGRNISAFAGAKAKTKADVNTTPTTTSQPLSGPYTGGGGGGGGAAFNPNPIRSDIRGRVNEANSIYESLFGDVKSITGERRAKLDESRSKAEAAAIGQLESDSDQLGRSYAARGLADSDYRTDAIGRLKAGFDQFLGEMLAGYNEDAARLGEYAATTEAGLRADQDSLGRVASQLGGIDEKSVLNELLGTVQSKLDELKVRRAGFNTDAGFASGLNQYAPSVDRGGQLLGNLKTLAAGLAPRMLREQVGQQLIQSSGLGEEEKKLVYSQFQQELQKQEQPTV